MPAFKLNAQLVLEASHAAALDYATLITDHDPEDGAHIVPGELRRFLARLRLLHGVPFSYLVPDARLLPMESIRFFYIDRAWTDALVQGALSVGTLSTADRAQLEAMYSHMRREVDETERTLQRRPDREKTPAGEASTLCGFLLRSAAVSGWPNLHVRGYMRDVLPDDALSTEADAHPDRVRVLRIERLAPAVLMVLFDGVPVVVHLEEPRQGLQFGVNRISFSPGGAASARLKVRHADTARLVAPIEDDQFTDTNSVAVPFRKDAPGVIHMRQLVQRLVDTAPAVGTGLEPHEFALQMLRFPYRQVFGDPDNRQGQSHYELKDFRVTLSLDAWKRRLTTQLDD